MSDRLARLVAVARGEAPADLVLANARVVNVFSGDIETASVAICGDRIAGVGDYRRAGAVLDVGGRHVAPGFINGHIHPESSMLDIGQYARAVVPHGTVALVTDLHEIANVCGLKGIDYVMAPARRLPLDLYLMAPSCVPATAGESSGASVTAADIRRLLRRRHCLGLGEVMDFLGVIRGDRGLLEKVRLAADRGVDGHAPGLGGKELNAYIAAGIRSDHESVSFAEAAEKLRRGMYLMIREGSMEKNLAALLPLVNDRTYHRCLLVVDDRTSVDLLHDGDVDAVARRAIALGLDPVRAIQMVTINPAQYFGLNGAGAVAPGYQADLVVLGDLAGLRVDMVFYRGRLVASEGSPRFDVAETSPGLAGSVRIKPFPVEALRLVPDGEVMPVIQVVPGQIVTRKRLEPPKALGGFVIPDTERDILKLVVVERHRATGNIGIGLVSGFNLKAGALASSIAHDSHNVIAVGTDDGDILAAINEVQRLQGGLVVAAGGKVVASLPLPVAGLLSAQPLEVVVSQMTALERAARELGTDLASPFAALSFLALPVIPEIRLTDRGLVEL